MPTSVKQKILVVNDDANSLFALASLLSQWADQDGYDVTAAASGEEALRHVLRHDFAVILLDVNMPGMDGFETAAAIHQRARSAEIPIIFVTAFLADEIDRLKAYQQGAVDFLFTPVIPQMLRAKVSVFVALATRNAELVRQAEQLRLGSEELSASNRQLTREVEERQAAEQQNHAKDEFLAMLGHELRNPLSAISSAAELIGMSNISAEALGRAKTIVQRQSRHLSRIVDDLLDLGRALSGKILLSRQPLELSALMLTCVDTFKATGRTTGYQFALELEAGWIDGDATRIEQIASNLIDNALKYTAPGGQIGLSVRSDDAEVILSVTDSGVGITADLLPQVFEVFVQGVRNIDRAQGGLGIGLALVRRLAELHGGSASAHSDGPGTGSTFEIRLPRAADAPTAGAANAAATGRDARPRLLLVEDNDDGREMMAMMLGGHGYQVALAADGLSGVQMAAQSLPRVALVDIGLPGIDGYEVARRLRADPRTAGIGLIALTGYGLAEDKRRVLDAGFNLHLVKPVDMDQLIAAIDTCMLATAD